MTSCFSAAVCVALLVSGLASHAAALELSEPAHARQLLSWSQVASPGVPAQTLIYPNLQYWWYSSSVGPPDVGWALPSYTAADWDIGIGQLVRSTSCTIHPVRHSGRQHTAAATVIPNRVAVA